MLRSVHVSLRPLVGFRGGGGGGPYLSVWTDRGMGADDQLHGHNATPYITSVRWFSGIRNIPRDEALKYMGMLKKTRSAREAINILKDIERDGFIPSVFNYSAAISKCAKDGKLKEAKKLFRQMQHDKVPPMKLPSLR